nr:hypothetical protein [uncultured bacterium]
MAATALGGASFFLLSEGNRRCRDARRNRRSAAIRRCR